jgi:cytochrome b
MQDGRAPDAPRAWRIWDLPVRVFHWAIVALLIVSWTSAEIGGNAMQVHVWSGLSVLTLVLFRVLWGFFGSMPARFASFLRGPRATWAYAKTLPTRGTAFFPGHNPLGGWMVIVLLANLLLQAATGLFSNDDVMLEGPLASRVSKETSDLLTKVHHLSFDTLLILIGLHIAAALFYLIVKRDNLIRPMITGRKLRPHAANGEPPAQASLWLALAMFLACAAVVWLPLA